MLAPQAARMATPVSVLLAELGLHAAQLLAYRLTPAFGDQQHRLPWEEGQASDCRCDFASLRFVPNFLVEFFEFFEFFEIFGFFGFFG